MKKVLIITLLLVSNICIFDSLKSEEIVEDKNLIEKVSFNIWWEEKYNDSSRLPAWNEMSHPAGTQGSRSRGKLRTDR